ncbi:MAG: c-type cytochrome domain-containing protein, partial [Rubripirellula sp.]
MLRISLLVILLSPTASWAEVDYEREVKPLLKMKCWACHGPLKQESGLRLDAGRLMKTGGDSGPVVVPGNSQQSLLLQRVTSTDELDRMPPEGEPLTEKQIEILKQWVESGAQSPADESPQVDP